jgi:hypothetical protein
VRRRLGWALLLAAAVPEGKSESDDEQDDGKNPPG